jgi:hypothetical protein
MKTKDLMKTRNDEAKKVLYAMLVRSKINKRANVSKPVGSLKFVRNEEKR